MNDDVTLFETIRFHAECWSPKFDICTLSNEPFVRDGDYTAYEKVEMQFVPEEDVLKSYDGLIQRRRLVWPPVILRCVAALTPVTRRPPPGRATRDPDPAGHLPHLLLTHTAQVMH